MRPDVSSPSPAKSSSFPVTTKLSRPNLSLADRGKGVRRGAASNRICRQQWELFSFSRFKNFFWEEYQIFHLRFRSWEDTTNTRIKNSNGTFFFEPKTNSTKI
jgi:hypothetical protein